MIQIFLSHSGQDALLAGLLVDLLKTAMTLRASELRCTSVEGYRLPAGADTAEQLRDELLTSPAFIGLISPQSFSSAYVLFELGARWGAKKHLVPLLAPGVEPSILRGPIAGLNALRCDVMTQVHQLVQDVASHLGREIEPPAVYQSKADAIMAYRDAAKLPGKPSGNPSVLKSADSKGEEYAGADEVIKRHCESEWPKDFAMCAHCIKQERRALAELKRGAPAGFPAEVFAEIRERCALEWPDHFSMRLHTEKQQVVAYREIQREE